MNLSAECGCKADLFYGEEHAVHLGGGIVTSFQANISVCKEHGKKMKDEYLSKKFLDMKNESEMSYAKLKKRVLEIKK